MPHVTYHMSLFKKKIIGETAKKLPKEHLICCRGVKLLILKDCFRFWQKLIFVRNWDLSEIEICQKLSFSEIEFCQKLSFVRVGVLSFIQIWVIDFWHNLSSSVLSQLLSLLFFFFISISLFDFCLYLRAFLYFCHNFNCVTNWFFEFCQNNLFVEILFCHNFSFFFLCQQKKLAQHLSCHNLFCNFFLVIHFFVVAKLLCSAVQQTF